MNRYQVLSSGIIIQQDFREAIRPIFFQTDLSEFQYATHGGTLFVVAYAGRVYALTCRHVFKDFEYGRLFVPGRKQAKKGDSPAEIKNVCYPSSPRAAAIDTDILDLCVIEFADDIDAAFFHGSAYTIHPKTVASSQIGNQLLVAGVLKEKTNIEPPDIVIGYCLLEFHDIGAQSADPVLRKAISLFGKPQFSSIAGISGSPVFDQTANALCGMVIRGGMNGNKCTIYYIDIFDIVRLLEGVRVRATNVDYTKHLDRRSSVRVSP
jgi:hypothetical protein